jgi:kynurenine--oxoglutarate transaminase/cysteine-S-conjugate beta-lyase/glutamine--phenylpyruvate transaminase
LLRQRMRRMASTAVRLSHRLDRYGAETVWQEFTPLARETGAVNLGQGFPDWPTPTFVKDAMRRTQDEDQNQYCRSAGHPPLVQALAAKYSAAFGRAINWETEVTVGVGASETLYASMQALLDPGDEAVLISPSFDIYAAQVQMAGGTPVYVPLRLRSGAGGGGATWELDLAELRAALTPRTRVLLLNNPQNPTGKILSRGELEGIAAILADFPAVVVVSDEVYEHIVFDGRDFPRMALVPGMWERTLTVSSSGKTFSCTGWKVGWAVGPEALVRGIVLTNQWVQFSVSTPSQKAIADALGAADAPYSGYPSYYAYLTARYTEKRAVLMAGLRAAGLNPTLPDGGFFIIADTSNIAFPAHYMDMVTKAAPVMKRDWAFCRFLAQEVKVAAIPPSAFFDGACAGPPTQPFFAPCGSLRAAHPPPRTIAPAQTRTRTLPPTWRALPFARRMSPLQRPASACWRCGLTQ